MFRNLVSALIEHEQIKTTYPKAKAISRLAERVITWSKYGTENIFYQRKAESYLMVRHYSQLQVLELEFMAEKYYLKQNWVQVRKHLFHNLAKRYETRCGGYTRIHRVGYRANDHAPLAIIELVDNARDLKRDKVIRTISRELAQLELSQKPTYSNTSSPSSIKAKIPAAVWRNVPCKSEAQAKQAIEEFQRLLPEMTKKNMKKVLSEQYIQAYQYCQPPQIPTKEEALIEAAQAKRLRRDLLRKAVESIDPSSTASNGSTAPTTVSLINRAPTPKPKIGNFAHVKGIPRPLGPYTDFLYHIRLHFHRNLALLDPNKLAGRLNKGFANPKPNLEESKILDQIPSFENA
jgi:ribosomal protein L17